MVLAWATSSHTEQWFPLPGALEEEEEGGVPPAGTRGGKEEGEEERERRGSLLGLVETWAVMPTKKKGEGEGLI